MRTVDYLGPSSRATADWGTRRYTISRVLIPTNRTGRLALAAYDKLRPLAGRLRGTRKLGGQSPRKEFSGQTAEPSAELETLAALHDEPALVEEHAGQAS